jgi:hypothetical protein
VIRLSQKNKLVIAAVVVAGLFAIALFGAGDDECAEWQARYRAAAEGSEGGVFTFINLGPDAALRRERPAGCAIPE